MAGGHSSRGLAWLIGDKLHVDYVRFGDKLHVDMACYGVTNCTWITLFFHRVLHHITAWGNWRQTVKQGHAFGTELKPGSLILSMDKPQSLKECAAEKLKFFITLTKLRLQ